MVKSNAIEVAQQVKKLNQVLDWFVLQLKKMERERLSVVEDFDHLFDNYLKSEYELEEINDILEEIDEEEEDESLTKLKKTLLKTLRKYGKNSDGTGLMTSFDITVQSGIFSLKSRFVLAMKEFPDPRTVIIMLQIVNAKLREYVYEEKEEDSDLE